MAEHLSEVKVEQHELVEFSDFKGHPVITLRDSPTTKYPFSFGLTKAALIIKHMEAIEDFVTKYSSANERVQL